MSKTKNLLVKTLFSCLLIVALPAMAADTASNDPLKSRQKLMKGMGKNMKEIKKALDGKTNATALPEQAKNVETAAKTLVTDLKVLFPAGSNKGKTDVKPLVWDKWADFEKIANDLSSKADAFAQAAGKGEQASIQSSFKDLAGVCKTCHKDYRTEK